VLTRHARRIYAGGIPPKAGEMEIANFFNDIVTRALLPTRLDEPPVVKVYLNADKCFAFIEFTTIELTTACMQLDGVKFEHYTGTTIVRVRRPNDYRPEILPPPGPIPAMNLQALGITAGTNAAGGGPGKIFIGGLPYNLADEQIMELLQAFGPIKSFHQVRDPGSVTSKGYGFCEYVVAANAEAAIAGLNGLALGEKTLSVRVATTSATSGGAGAGAGAGGAMGGGMMGNMGMNAGGAGNPMMMGMGMGMGGMPAGGAGGYYGAAPVPMGMGMGGGPPPTRVRTVMLFSSASNFACFVV
jgi:splicing factor U2AF 65 kDa subunit